MRAAFASLAWCWLLILAAGCAQLGPDELRVRGAERSSTLDAVLDRGVLKVGTTADFLPFTYLAGPDDRRAIKRSIYRSIYRGIDVELAKDLARALDVELEFVRTSWPRLMEDLAAGAFDIGMGGITITLARQREALFSSVTSTGGKVAISRDEDAARLATLAAINRTGVRVIVNPGGTNEAFARERLGNATIVLNDDNVTIFEQLLAGRADVMVTDRIEAIVQSEIHPELAAINAEEPFSVFEYGYLLPRDPVWKAFVDTWLRTRKNDGTFGRVFEAELERAAELGGADARERGERGL